MVAWHDLETGKARGSSQAANRHHVGAAGPGERIVVSDEGNFPSPSRRANPSARSGTCCDLLSTISSKEDGFILYRLTSLSVNKGEALLGVATPMADG